MHYVYALQLGDGSIYVGYTMDLEARVNTHKLGKVYSTKHKLPIDLIYYEGCRNKYDALRREKYLKAGPGRKFLLQRLKGFFN